MHRSSSISSKSNLKFTKVADGIIHSTGKVASSGVKQWGKGNGEAAAYSTRLGSIMESQQDINFTRAKQELSDRRMERKLSSLEKFVVTEKDTSAVEAVSGWLVDHGIFLFDVVLGFLGPVITLIAWSLLRVVLVVVCNVIFFGGLYLLLIWK